MPKIILWTIYGVTVAMVIIVGLLYWPVKVIDIKNSDAIQLDKKIYKRGDRITYTLDYCKYRNAPATVSRALVNSIRINFTAYYNNLPKGCALVKNSDLVIPEFTDVGTYHIETTIEYQINPLRRIFKNWRSVDFQVVEPPLSGENLLKKIDQNTKDIKDNKIETDKLK